ncbi:hypothetical protein [Salinilacihabitans rarus]|uniref:hypothetical protein n=1 Tax=Salinilacihabitans rarus TaxID=2961596 RepID=UPI0020C8B38F|nr:hypothetical protein [Salinilacihabitans rarus]
MDGETVLDGSVIVGTLPYAAWMALTGRPLSTVGLLLFSLTAALRIASPGVRAWTDEHRWAFLAMVIPMLVLATLGAMPPT